MGYTAAVVEELDADVVGPVAADIEAVAHLVADEGSLGANLTDFGVPTAARRAVLEDLLATRVQPAALRLVLWAVGTSRADDLNTTLHELFELVLHLHELGPDEVRAEEPALSRTGQRNFASGYAEALFEELTGPGDLQTIEEELFRLARIIESQPALRSALSDPSRPADGRGQLLGGLVAGKVEPTTLRLAVMSLRGRLRDVVGALDRLAEQAARARGWRVARVSTARPIDDDEQSAMADALGQRHRQARRTADHTRSNPHRRRRHRDR